MEANNSTVDVTMVLSCHFLFSFSVCPCEHLGLFLKGRKGLIQGFGELTLCVCVTVMAVGYRAQGQGGSKEMYFYSCFQGTVLVQRLMSQERCKPPSNESPSPGQKALSLVPLNYLHRKCDCFSGQLKLFWHKGRKANTYYLSVGTGAQKNRRALE